VDDIAAAANVSPRTFRNYFSTKAEAIAAGHLERMLCIADALRTRHAAEPLWDAIANAVTTQFQPPPQTGRSVPDAGSWIAQIQFIVTEPAIHAEVLKATAAAQDELAGAIAERTATSVAHDMYPQLAAAAVGGGIAVAVEHWLRSGPVGPLVPVLHEMFSLIRTGLPAPGETPLK
jgi:AcrR family transcriptional regulator